MTTAQRRVNSTGRKKIKHEDIEIIILPPRVGEPLEATLKLDHENWEFPKTAKIILEAYHRNSGMRFECGNLESPQIPEILKLVDLDSSSSVLFRLKVVEGEDGSGRLLGSAERIRAGETNDNSGRRSLFPIILRDIGDDLTRVEISDAGPALVLNLRVPGFTHRIIQNPIIGGTLLPTAFKEVLSHLISNFVSDGESDGSWEADWIEFCIQELNVSDPSDLNDKEERSEWVEDTVSAFCRKNEFVYKARNFLKEVV